MEKWMNIFAAIAWLVFLIALFFGYEPIKFQVGCAFLICLLDRLQALERNFRR